MNTIKDVIDSYMKFVDIVKVSDYETIEIICCSRYGRVGGPYFYAHNRLYTELEGAYSNLHGLMHKNDEKVKSIDSLVSSDKSNLNPFDMNSTFSDVYLGKKVCFAIRDSVIVIADAIGKLKDEGIKKESRKRLSVSFAAYDITPISELSKEVSKIIDYIPKYSGGMVKCDLYDLAIRLEEFNNKFSVIEI